MKFRFEVVTGCHKGIHELNERVGDILKVRKCDGDKCIGWYEYKRIENGSKEISKYEYLTEHKFDNKSGHTAGGYFDLPLS